MVTPPDRVVQAILSFGLIARQPDAASMDREAAEACDRMTHEELTIAQQAAGALDKHASAKLGRRPGAGGS